MLSVIVIDDDKSLREGIGSFLESLGYHIMLAKDGKQAKEYLNNHKFDLAITDIVMPETDGIEIVMFLKNKYPAMKIIAMSGGGKIVAKDYLEIVTEMGVDGTLSKPFQLDNLISLIKKIESSLSTI